MLGIGLMLFVLRDMDKSAIWKDKWIKFAFWSINIGLAAMVLLSVFPIGLAQTVASIKDGLWFARSADFMQQPYMVTLKWMRVFGDTMFAAGTLALVWFIFGLKGGWSHENELIILYWLPPKVLETHCTGVGAVAAAKNTTVLPVLVKAFVLIYTPIIAVDVSLSIVIVPSHTKFQSFPFASFSL